MTTRELSPTFKTVLLVVVVFTALSFLGSFAITFVSKDKDTTEPLLEMTVTTFKLGFGALVGLLGGKTI